MSRIQYTLASALLFSLVSAGSALAANGTNPAPVTPTTPTTPSQPSAQPTPVPRDDVKFRCLFRGAFSDGKGKGGGWAIACRARGQISVDRIVDFFWTMGDQDDFLRVTCSDGDNDRDDRDDDDDGRVIYKGPVLYGQLPDFDDVDRGLGGGKGGEIGEHEGRRELDAIITGVRTISPVIKIEDINLKRIGKDDDDRDGRRERERRALLTFVRHRIQYALPGECRFEKKENNQMPVPLR